MEKGRGVTAKLEGSRRVTAKTTVISTSGVKRKQRKKALPDAEARPAWSEIKGRARIFIRVALKPRYKQDYGPEVQEQASASVVDEAAIR